MAGNVPIPLVVVLLAGLGLRLYAIDVYRPAAMTMNDSTAYVWGAAGSLYGDAVRPAGYSLFLRMAHGISSDLRFTIGLQHLVGLATATFLYLITRRVGAPRWLSAVPAAVFALSGDQVLLEHTLLSESVFTLLLCAAVYAAIRTLDGHHSIVWAGLSGLLIATAATVRTAALVLVPLFAVWATVSAPKPWRRRFVTGATALVAAAALLGVYAGLQDRSEGTWALGRTSGWALYSRVAPFADCSEFTPPRGTRFLCESTPPDQRQGPDYYGWVGGPARTRYGEPPNGNPQLRDFAEAVVVHQPLDYAKVVIKDTVRYFVPSFGFDRPNNGTGPELMAFDRRGPGFEEPIERVVESYYDPFDLRLSPGGVRALATYQELFRVHGILLLEFVLLGIAAVFLSRGRSRNGVVLVVGTTLVLLFVPVATTIYSARYASPLEGLAAVGAVVALQAAAERLMARGRRASLPRDSA